jgi:nickel superoxide dismutase
MFSRLSARGVVASIVDRIRPPMPVYAHCDIPCGIYDPHLAQLSALTVLRMDQLIGDLPKPSSSSKPEEMESYSAKLARYMEVKESHAEKVKSELRIIWGDYVTPDHLKQWPDLHDKFWKAMKVASKARQGTALADAQELVKTVQDVAEAFWKTKGVATKRQPSQQKPGGEIVYPTA